MAKKHLFFVCPSSHFPTSSSRPRLSKYKLVYRKRANEKQQNIFALKRHSFSKKKMNVKKFEFQLSNIGSKVNFKHI